MTRSCALLTNHNGLPPFATVRQERTEMQTNTSIRAPDTASLIVSFENVARPVFKGWDVGSGSHGHRRRRSRSAVVESALSLYGDMRDRESVEERTSIDWTGPRSLLGLHREKQSGVERVFFALGRCVFSAPLSGDVRLPQSVPERVSANASAMSVEVQWLCVKPDGSVFAWDGSSLHAISTFRGNMVELCSVKWTYQAPGRLKFSRVSPFSNKEICVGEKRVDIVDWNDLKKESTRSVKVIASLSKEDVHCAMFYSDELCVAGAGPLSEIGTLVVWNFRSNTVNEVQVAEPPILLWVDRELRLCVYAGVSNKIGVVDMLVLREISWTFSHHSSGISSMTCIRRGEDPCDVCNTRERGFCDCCRCGRLLVFTAGVNGSIVCHEILLGSSKRSYFVKSPGFLVSAALSEDPLVFERKISLISGIVARNEHHGVRLVFHTPWGIFSGVVRKGAAPRLIVPIEELFARPCVPPDPALLENVNSIHEAVGMLRPKRRRLVSIQRRNEKVSCEDVDDDELN